jgi:hypothetical protein
MKYRPVLSGFCVSLFLILLFSLPCKIISSIIGVLLTFSRFAGLNIRILNKKKLNYGFKLKNKTSIKVYYQREPLKHLKLISMFNFFYRT